jgi:hypothetical protein
MPNGGDDYTSVLPQLLDVEAARLRKEALLEKIYTEFTALLNGDKKIKGDTAPDLAAARAAAKFDEDEGIRYGFFLPEEEEELFKLGEYNIEEIKHMFDRFEQRIFTTVIGGDQMAKWVKLYAIARFMQTDSTAFEARLNELLSEDEQRRVEEAFTRSPALRSATENWLQQKDQLVRDYKGFVTDSRVSRALLDAASNQDPEGMGQLRTAMRRYAENPNLKEFAEVTIKGVTLTSDQIHKFLNGSWDEERQTYVPGFFSLDNIDAFLGSAFAQTTTTDLQNSFDKIMQDEKLQQSEDMVYDVNDWDQRLKDQQTQERRRMAAAEGMDDPAKWRGKIKAQMRLSGENGGLDLTEHGLSGKALDEYNAIIDEVETALANRYAEGVGSENLAEDLSMFLLGPNGLMLNEKWRADTFARVNQVKLAEERKEVGRQRKEGQQAALKDYGTQLQIFTNAGVDVGDPQGEFARFLGEEFSNKLQRAILKDPNVDPADVAASMAREQPGLYGTEGAQRFDPMGPTPNMLKLFPQGPEGAARGVDPIPYELKAREQQEFMTGSATEEYRRQTEREMGIGAPPRIGEDVPGREVPIAQPDIFQPLGEEVDPVQARREGRGILKMEEVLEAAQAVAGDRPDLLQFLLSGGEGGRLSTLLKDFEKAQQADIDERMKKTIYGHGAPEEKPSETVSAFGPTTGGEFQTGPETNGKGKVVQALPGAERVAPYSEGDIGGGGLSGALQKLAGISTDQYVNLAKLEVLDQPNIKFLDFLKERIGEEHKLLDTLKPKERTRRGRNIVVKARV